MHSLHLSHHLELLQRSVMGDSGLVLGLPLVSKLGAPGVKPRILQFFWLSQQQLVNMSYAGPRDLRRIFQPPSTFVDLLNSHLHQKGLDRARQRGSSRSIFDQLSWEVFSTQPKFVSTSVSWSSPQDCMYQYCPLQLGEKQGTTEQKKHEKQ